MTQYWTDFSEYTSFVPPSDWTEYWTTTAFYLDIRETGELSPKRLQINMTTLSQRVSCGWDDAGSVADSEVLCKVKWLAAGTFEIGPGVRLSGGTNENGYALFLDDSANQIKLRRYVAGAGSTDLATHTHTMTTGVYYWARLKIVGDNIKASVWTDGSSEPTSWDIDYTDLTPYSTAGASGLVNYSQDGWCDYISIGTGGDTAPLAKIETPDIAQPSGAYQASQLISISCDTSGSDIYYTTDGSTPDSGDTLYSAPFALTTAKTVKAIGIKTGLTDSDVASETYTIVVISIQPIITVIT